MRVARRIGIAVVTAALAAGWGIGRAGDPPAADPPGASLLEFLGSVDPASDSKQPDDGSWLAYLSQIDIGKVAKASQASQAPQPPGQTKPADSQPAADKPGG
ncbi:MAG: hypothetical protein WBE91_15975 [Steroidobacteraceae bacterium]